MDALQLESGDCNCLIIKIMRRLYNDNKVFTRQKSQEWNEGKQIAPHRPTGMDDGKKSRLIAKNGLVRSEFALSTNDRPAQQLVQHDSWELVIGLSSVRGRWQAN